jgi:hypothetical protein
VENIRKPAIVKFIGDQTEYRQKPRSSGSCPQEQQTGEYEFLNGKTYEAYFVEYFADVRNALHVKGEDGEIHAPVRFEHFTVISDPDHVLADYEAMVRFTTHRYEKRWKQEPQKPIFGKTYKAIGKDNHGRYLIVNEHGMDKFYPAEDFEILEDPHGILQFQSIYDDFCGEYYIPDYIEARCYTNNHMPELTKDKLCGCARCLKIFSPKEITKWNGPDEPETKDEDEKLRDQQRRGLPPIFREGIVIINRGTAFCPYCGTYSSVIGESSGFPITPEFLQKMNAYLFEEDQKS